MNFNDIIPILQIAIGPTILISAVGLLLLTLNNRLMHAIDRARGLSDLIEHSAQTRRDRLAAETGVIWRRTRLIRRSMELAALSALLAAILVITLFVAALENLSGTWTVTVLFISSLSALVGSLCYLILDVHQSLVALKLELEVTGIVESATPESSSRRPQ
jgi:hypothetical protein